jgi:hypothetical protein
MVLRIPAKRIPIGLTGRRSCGTFRRPRVF